MLNGWGKVEKESCNKVKYTNAGSWSCTRLSSTECYEALDSDVTKRWKSSLPQLVKLSIAIKKHTYRRHADYDISRLDRAGKKLLSNPMLKDLLHSRAAVGTRPLLIRERAQGLQDQIWKRPMPHACYDEQSLKR